MRARLAMFFAVIALVALACSAAGPTGTISGQTLAGPTCPVETNPPDPACAPAPVADAVVVAYDADGREVARTKSDKDGRFTLSLAAGEYSIGGEPTSTTMAPPKERVAVSVIAGQTSAPVVLLYDTGIR